MPPFNPGTVATLGCITGYAPVGPTIARCLKGSWTLIGDCQPIREQRCPPIAHVPNGQVKIGGNFEILGTSRVKENLLNVDLFDIKFCLILV